MSDLTPTEKDILMALQMRGKEFLRPDTSALADAVGRDEQHVRNALKKLEGAKIIKYYAAIVDAETLGFMTLFVDLICEVKLDEVIGKISAFKNTKEYKIVAAYIITGEKDIHLEVKVKGIEGYKRFIRAFGTIQQVGTACGTLGYEKFVEDRILELGGITKSEEQ